MVVEGTSETKRDHFIQAEKHGVHIPELHVVPPESVWYIWEWYCDLVSTEGGASYSEIHSWAVLLNETIRPWEVRTLRRLDQERRRCLTSPSST